MKIIDFSVSIGYKTLNYNVVNHENLLVREQVKQVKNAEELLAELDFCGIDSAVVNHNAMTEVDPNYGNRLVLEETAKASGRLFPSWTILPPVTEEQFTPHRLFPAMKRAGVKFLRANPEVNRYMLNKVAMGELLSAISKARIPLYVSTGEGWHTLYQLLQEFPKLTVILCNYGLWSHSRLTYPLLRAYPNFYIETGDMQAAGELKEICDKFGSERLLFGSDYPSNGIGGPLATLLGSGIGEDELLNIAYRNGERLMNEVSL